MDIAYGISRMHLQFILAICAVGYTLPVVYSLPVDSQSQNFEILSNTDGQTPAEFAVDPSTVEQDQDLSRIDRSFRNPFVIKRTMMNTRGGTKQRSYYRNPFILKRDGEEIFLSKDSFRNPFVLRSDVGRMYEGLQQDIDRENEDSHQEK